MVNLKKQIAILLRDVERKENPRADLEQYELNSEIASQFVHNLILNYSGNEILDAGCGSGILTLTACLAGIERVVALDIDREAIRKLKVNSAKIGCSWKIDSIVADFKNFSFSRKIGAIMMNPPFGTKKRHADRDFLIKAFELSNKVFSLHKKGNDDFFRKLALNFGFKMKILDRYKLILKPTMPFHRKLKHYVEAIQYYFEKNE